MKLRKLRTCKTPTASATRKARQHERPAAASAHLHSHREEEHPLGAQVRCHADSHCTDTARAAVSSAAAMQKSPDHSQVVLQERRSRPNPAARTRALSMSPQGRQRRPTQSQIYTQTQHDSSSRRHAGGRRHARHHRSESIGQSTASWAVRYRRTGGQLLQPPRDGNQLQGTPGRLSPQRRRARPLTVAAVRHLSMTALDTKRALPCAPLAVLAGASARDAAHQCGRCPPSGSQKPRSLPRGSGSFEVHPPTRAARSCQALDRMG